MEFIATCVTVLAALTNSLPSRVRRIPPPPCLHPESMGDASIYILIDATLRGTDECQEISSSFISPHFRFDSLTTGRAKMSEPESSVSALTSICHRVHRITHIQVSSGEPRKHTEKSVSLFVQHITYILSLKINF